MKAVFHTGLPCEWADSLGEFPWCMAPLGGKPLIEYWFEWAAELQIRDVRLILNEGASEIESFCGNGERWGLNISYGFIRNISDPEAYLRRSPQQWENGLFYISSPVFPKRLGNGPRVGSSQAHIADTAGSTRIFKDKDGSPACYISSEKNDIHAFITGEPQATADGWSNTSVKPVLIDNLRSYYQLNMDLVQGEIIRYVPPGFGGGDQAYIGSNVLIPPSAELHPPLIIGNNCRIQPMAIIGPDAVIGNNVIIDSQTVLTGSIVMNNTYLGSNLEIIDRVVSGSQLITPEDGTVVDIDDPWLLAPIKTKIRTNDIIRAAGGWLAALLLTLLQVLPFSVFYILLRTLRIGKFQLSTQKITGSREMLLPYWMTEKKSSISNSVFTKLSLDLFPLIALVVAGRLWLCGHKPLHPERDADLLKKLSRYYPAVFGYHSLNKTGQESVAVQGEALYYQRYCSLYEDMHIVTRALFERIITPA